MSTPKRKKKEPLNKVRTGKTKENRLARIHYALLIGFIILFVIHYTFFEEKTLGHDMRYTLYVFWGPTLSGCIALAIYQWQTLKDVFQEIKTVKDYALAILFLPLFGLLISYLSFGSMANIAFTYLNKKEAEQHIPQVFHCQVKRFYHGRRKHNMIDFKFNNTIDFEFNKRSESFPVSNSDIKSFSSSNPSDYDLEIVAQKGLWDYYIVKDWNLKKR